MAKVYLEDTELKNIGDAIRRKNNQTTKYLPSEMPAAIDAITGGGTGVLKRSQLIPFNYTEKEKNEFSYLFYGGRVIPNVTGIYDDTGKGVRLTWTYSLIPVSDEISLTPIINISRIDSLGHCFSSFGRSSIKANGSLDGIVTPEKGAWVDEQLEKIIQLKEDGVIYTTDFGSMFFRCLLTKMPSWMYKISKDIDWQSGSNKVYLDYMFAECRLLEEIDFVAMGFPKTYKADFSNRLTNYGFANNYSLKQIKGLPLCANPMSVNDNIGLDSMNDECLPRLRSFTFGFNGKLKAYNYNFKCKYWGWLNFIPKNDSDDAPIFLEDKEIKDAATYATLKNDPKAWTRDVTYSFFNKASVIEMIESAPDMSSASVGVNTFTFYAKQGSNTDGGAIGDLTDKEIAVATAKNITIALY